MKNNTIGVHFQTYKNREAVEIAISSFREHYTNAPFRMVSDAGEDFSDLAQKYNCIFDYETKNIYPKAIFAGHPLILPVCGGEADYRGAKIWLKRVYDTAKLFDTDWIVLYEDDVYTQSKILEFPTTDAGGAPGSRYNAGLLNILYNRCQKQTIWEYGMVGGSIFNREFFVNAYEKYIDEFDVKYLASIDDRVGGWSDILINSFIAFSGGNYNVWSGLGGGNYNPHAPFLHGDKSKYIEKQGNLYEI